MKSNTAIRISMACLGAAALALHLAAQTAATDHKGLLLPGHPLMLLLWAVAAAAVITGLVLARRAKGSSLYRDNFPPSLPACLGSFALAAGILMTTISGWTLFPRLELIRNLAGLLAVPALAAAGVCRLRGRQPFFGCHGILCVYLILHTVSHYQIWCSRPQLGDWFFPMAASVTLALFAYQQTAFDADMGRRRMQLAMGALAGFFCLGAAPLENSMLYLGGALWALTGLCSMKDGSRHEAA